MSGTGFYTEPLNADRIDESRSSYLGCDPLDIRGVARNHPQSEGGCNSISLNVGSDTFGESPRHQGLDSPDVREVTDNSPVMRSS